MYTPLRIILIGWMLIMATTALSQSRNPLTQARSYVAEQQFDSARLIYKVLYEEAPFDLKVYEEYMNVLLALKAYDEALQVANYMTEIKKDDPYILMDVANVYALKKEKKQADKIIDGLVQSVAHKKPYEVKKIANAFRSKGMNKQAIAVYEAASQSSVGQDYFDQLVGLYLTEGMLEKSLPLYVEMIPYNPSFDAEMKGKLLEYMQQDPKHKQAVITFINKKLKQKNSNNGTYVSLLTWVNNLEGNQEQALEQLLSLDKKEPNSMHKEIYTFSEEAFYNRQYDIAAKGYSYIVASSTASNFYEGAYTALLKTLYAQLLSQRPVNPQLIAKAKSTFDAYFQSYPQKIDQIEYLWYMELIAKFERQPQQAISLLDSVLTHARVSKEYTGHAKLALGDYHLIHGEPWQANLYYVQVDKLFRQDMLGEEARFKQAKLAFYRGDFEWAELQLNVLKESTTELISNDAMSLSIMITENTFSDSNVTPLKMYAQADLLMSQYQFMEALQMLDSIIVAYPGHDLLDDVYMLQASIAKEEGRYKDAIDQYNKVIKEYGDDVLADDAVYQSALIYEVQLQDIPQAKKLYEQLIVDYPNSTLTGVARERYASLQSQANKP